MQVLGKIATWNIVACWEALQNRFLALNAVTSNSCFVDTIFLSLYLQGDESKVQNHWVKFDVGSGVSIFGGLDVDREFCQQEKEKGVMIKHSRSRV
jgi:hypothetical protein